MSGSPIEIIIAAFQDSQTASNALDVLRQARNEGLIKILDAAVLTKDEKGKVKIKDTANSRAGKRAVIGAVTGGVLSLLAGPLGLMALGGGLIGGLGSKLRTSGFSGDRLKRVAESLTPNSSALIAVVEHTWVSQVENLLAVTAVEVVTEALAADIAAQLQSGGEVAYSLTDTGEEVIAERVSN